MFVILFFGTEQKAKIQICWQADQWSLVQSLEQEFFSTPYLIRSFLLLLLLLKIHAENQVALV